MNPQNFLMIGLPATGKTSFLAALWNAINQDQIETALVLDKLDGEYAYVNKICDSWLGYEPVGRNQMDVETRVSMWLKERNGDQKVHLTFPDISGETFKQQWATRQLTASYQECIKTADGGLLFVHPKVMVEPLRISQIRKLADLVKSDEEETSVEAKTPKPPTTPWDIEKAPTQVQLVELLQFLTSNQFFKPPFKLAIVVSAWDEIAASKLKPSAWLNQQLPLLDQYLASHKDKFHVSFFGISAQGGKYEGKDLVAMQKKNPAERVQVVGEGIENEHDITEPLLWLMQGVKR
jgi:hypothetical protein